MCRRTRVPVLPSTASSDFRFWATRPRSASTLRLSRAVNLTPNSPPRALSLRQATTPSTTISLPLFSKRQTSGAPLSGRYAVRRCMPRALTSTASASNAGMPGSLPQISTRVSSETREADEARRSWGVRHGCLCPRD